MTLEQLCCSLESAKRLRELGVTKKGIFIFDVHEGDILGIRGHDNYLGPIEYSVYTYTAAELLEVLPDEIFCKKEYVLTVNTLGLPRLYYVHYVCYGYELIKNYTGHLNLAEACALCLIHLIENNLVSLEEVNR